VVVVVVVVVESCVVLQLLNCVLCVVVGLGCGCC